MTDAKRILYCHCVYAQVVPKEVKAEVLHRLGASERDFEAVPDLCAMAARQDPELAELAADPSLEIVACYPRAVRWLFHAGGRDLDAGVVIHNMRTSDADAITSALELEESSVTEGEIR
jgi:hypothetical protein